MTPVTSPRRVAGVVVAVAALALAIVPELIGAEAGGVTAHHLKHAALILAGIIAGVLAPLSVNDDRREHLAWLVPTVLAPMVTMFVMWPTTYEYIEARPALHVLEHLVILALAVLTSYSGERYAKGIGGIAGVALVLMAIGAAFGYGVILGSS